MKDNRNRVQLKKEVKNSYFLSVHNISLFLNRLTFHCTILNMEKSKIIQEENGVPPFFLNVFLFRYE